LANYVTLSGTETITGAKTFTAALTQSGGDANFDNNTLFVDESENRVGIGTSSPQFGFELVGSGANGVLAATRTGTNGGGVSTIFYTNSDAKTANDGIIFPFNMRNSSNSVATYASIVAYIGDPGAGFHEGYLTFNTTNNAAQVEKMRITSSGYVGIGETSPSEKLDVNGKVKIQDLTGTGGNAVYENGGVLGVASDARFKTYMGDIVNGIELINQLKPKYFIDNRNSSFQQLGFYAQEVKSVINEASYPIGNTDYLGINDRAILATSVKAIQEQQTIILTQEQKITDLETTIQALITRIEILENK